ncbi:MAG: hypothetical protein GX200_09400 [Firmicutes bacterium]|nr:hypothetical protein [Bacillota bacterium]
MKKVLSLFLVVLLCLTLMVGAVGCEGNKEPVDGNSNTEANDAGEVDTNNDIGANNDVEADTNNAIGE